MEEKVDNKKKIIIISSIVGVLTAIIVAVVLTIIFARGGSDDANKISINLGDTSSLKTYTSDDFDSFKSDYNNNSLPAVYVTEFLFDGVGMYKTYDLDDFIEDGNDAKVKALSAQVFNISASGDFEFTGEITGGMIAVNTNNLKGDINIILNGVKIDTDSKKIPAVYVYNKDITYDEHKVTIKTAEGTENYLEGGKFKKVSLVDKDSLANYADKYSGDANTWYQEYSNYYGVYTAEEIENILFAKATADSEDLADGDPYYFYKGAGAISSDIDLYFEGTGILNVVSKNKEGIETKGNLSFTGGTGDYIINAEDDCLNTTTKSTVSGAHNALYINVKSLRAIVSLEADEGDAIDSNGTLTIDGGNIVALAKPGADAGLDSEKGTYINGGTIIATGNMFDAISSESKQNFLALSFSEAVDINDVIRFTNSDGQEIFVHETNRAYTNLVYSSSALIDGEYTLTKNDELMGYASTGNMGGMGQPGGEPGGMPGEMGEPGETPPEMPDGEMPGGVSGTPPEMPGGEMPGDANGAATNKTFTISGISNLFSGVAVYSEK
ncbi:MAG: carbohydrate-binding domain-containing protein [Candidatus Saccharibacteria bacterium]|nr:carbohydrate-binding domain-containing protein [Candidatus Saccharibacteria bacterium]